MFTLCFLIALVVISAIRLGFKGCFGGTPESSNVGPSFSSSMCTDLAIVCVSIWILLQDHLK